MLTRGVPLKVVSDILGHSSIAITGDIYGHVSPDVARQAMDTLGHAFDRWPAKATTVAPCDRRTRRGGGLEQSPTAVTAARAPGKGGLMVVEPPRNAVRVRAGSLRTRPLSCGLTVGLTGFEPATP